jgi:putative membrane protein
LSKLSGAEFDKAYMQAMVGDHDHDVALFRTYSEQGDDPEIKQWAGKTLPTLQEHERLAKTTANKVGVDERTGTRGHAAGAAHAKR